MAKHGKHEGRLPSREKACKIVEDGQVNGKPLTEAQRRLFQMICHGGNPTRLKEG